MDNSRTKVGLGALIFNSQGQLLLGKRKNSHGTASWEAPGGHLEYGESFEDCVIRKAREEVGLEIHLPTFFAMTNDLFESDKKHYTTIFMMANLSEGQIVQNLEPHKVEEWHWFDLTHLPDSLFLPLRNLLHGKAYGATADLKDHDNVLNELVKCEPKFHHPAKFGRSKQDILDMVGDEFWEVGASGNAYSREEVIDVLLERYSDPKFDDLWTTWKTTDFKLTKIALNNYLITYILTQGERITRRSTIWRFEDGRWKVLYHQGTIVKETK